MEQQQKFDEKDLLIEVQNKLNDRTLTALSNQIAQLSRERAIFAAQSEDFRERLHAVLEQYENVKAENEALKKEIEKLRGDNTKKVEAPIQKK